MAGGIEAVAGDDAGDVRPVTVVVVLRAPLLTKSTASVTRRRLGPAPRRNVRSSWRLTPESMTATPTPVPSRPLRGPPTASTVALKRAEGGLRDELAVFVHAQDGRISGERIEVGVVDVHHVRVERLQVRAAKPAGARDDRRGFRVWPELDEHAGSGRSGLRGPGDRDRA